MFWTDRRWLTSAFVAQVDPDAVAAASAEGLAIDGAGGLLDSVYAALSADLRRAAAAFSGYWTPYARRGLTQSHLALVYAESPVGGRYFDLSQAVLDSGRGELLSELELWAAWAAAEELFTSAMNRAQATDRYADKAFLARENRHKRWLAARRAGVPITLRPLAAPAAPFERQAGSFGGEDLTRLAGEGELDAGQLRVAVTWTAGRYDEIESAPGPELTLHVAAADALQISLANLNPLGPSSVSALSPDHFPGRLVPTGWNVYAGRTTLRRQNEAPLLLAQATTYELAALSESGAVLGRGQEPDVAVPLTAALTLA